MWKGTVSQSFGRFNSAETVFFRKISTTGNLVKLRYFTQCYMKGIHVNVKANTGQKPVGQHYRLGVFVLICVCVCVRMCVCVCNDKINIFGVFVDVEMHTYHVHLPVKFLVKINIKCLKNFDFCWNVHATKNSKIHKEEYFESSLSILRLQICFSTII